VSGEQLFDPAAYSLALRLHLARLRITGREAARRIGVDKSVISRICRHDKEPSVETYLRINRWMACTAQVGRNAKRQDPNEDSGLGPKDEHAVGCEDSRCAHTPKEPTP
jgi:transcriptional regulator with XRE-family HTH domain